MATFEEQQSFLRSTIPAGTAGAKEVAGLPVSSIPPIPSSTGLNLDISNLTSALDLSKATQSPFTTQDTSKLLSDLRGQQLKVAELLKPSTREQQLQQQIGTLQSGLESDISTLEARPGIDFFTFGRGVSQTERESALRQAPLQRQLQIEQQGRLGELAGQKFLSESTQQQLTFANQLEQQAFQRQQSIFQIVNTLRDDARSLYTTITGNLKGLGWEDLDSSTRTQLTGLSKNIGLDISIVKAGLDAEKQLAQSQKLKTQVVEVGGRKVLVDLATGATIKDLGVAEVPGTSPVDVRQKNEALAGFLAQVGTYDSREKALDELDKFGAAMLIQVGQDGLNQVVAEINRRFPPPSTKESKDETKGRSFLSKVFGKGGLLNPVVEGQPLPAGSPTTESSIKILNEGQSKVAKSFFGKLFGRGGIFNPNVQ